MLRRIEFTTGMLLLIASILVVLLVNVYLALGLLGVVYTLSALLSMNEAIRPSTRREGPLELNLTEEEALLFNPKRFAIATVLYLRGTQTMAELKKAVGLTWGDLDSNLRYPRKQLVEIQRTITRAGPRTIIKLTRKGEASYKSLVIILILIII